jgi:membrane protease YdiL (CAAX protease family)
MIQGMAEEVLCRSYLLISIGRRYPMWLAVLLNALFFAILHLANPGMGVLPFINLTLFGVFASVYFIKRGSIWGIGAVHSIWNFVQGNFYGIKVSGNNLSCTVFESTVIESKNFINGGDFGLEGGIAVTIVLVLGTLLLLIRPAKSKVEEVEPQVEVCE